ncbi:MAG: tRNA threonylcarbamoyladenosine biosynthesis protein RimN [Gammaproteobacteria bacterium]|uniref:Threonylcarbamoyl-AMP synthase n=1 Tax=OM182 bacterium MED-G24 TaxID=1986255 RepID=A0A2A5WXA5_9GAMM|nr:tRNA threonylcarbamoyladenosine biosynthesis protein RimN [Gammaproteobacteria bacterium]PDH41149.1 MAG: tRNA threonylcarbamoyladenosine biosynthesis protein RimN [OM182 bacterium MED-G24]RPG27327.1 MAG: tRNA threonylcarbamoyladenosine biosynthesis protein RimN [Gammaproteobacteria bacterium TMED50]
MASVVVHLRAGGVIAYPTEGVWGLGGLPANEEAVRRILTLKDRPVEAGLILVAGEISQVEPYLGQLTIKERERLVDHWPGPVTLLIPDTEIAPNWIRGQHESVAIRVSMHPTIQALCDAVGGPIVSTSANPSGLEPARTSSEAEAYFGSSVVYVEGQTAGMGKPSRIIELRTGREIRG